MAITVTMPQLGETVTEGTILSWAKAPGDTIAEDEVLLEISTDKVDTEVPSPAGGVIQEILVAEGETVSVGTPLAVIGEPGEAVAEAPSAAPEPGEPAETVAVAEATDAMPGAAPGAPEPYAPAAAAPEVVESAVEAAPEPEAPAPVAAAAPASMAAPMPTDDAPRRGVLSPVVRKLAAEHGIDLNHVVGTGDGGRITRSDVMAYIDAGGAKVAVEPQAPPVSPESAAPVAEEVTADEALAETVPEEAAPEVAASLEAPEPVAPAASTEAEAGDVTAAEVPEAHEEAAAAADTPAAPYVAAPEAPSMPPAAAAAAAGMAAVAATAPEPIAPPAEPDVAAAVMSPAAEAAPAPAAEAAPAAAAATATAPVAAAAAPAAADSEDDNVRPIGRLRRRIADNMVMAKATAAHVWTSVEVDYENVERVRHAHKASFKAQHGFSLTYLPFISRATMDALHAFPVVNSAFRLDEGQQVFHDEVDLGIAVDMDQGGLVVVTIKDADNMRMGPLAKEIRNKAVKAREGNLEPDDVANSTFTITNPGPYGSFMSAPIINVPNAAILSTDTVSKRATVIGLPDGTDTIAIRPIGYLGLTWDHRVFDGSTAVLFLQRIKHNLETWDWEQELS